MQEWLIGFGVFGVWACVHHLSRVAQSTETLAKNMGGLRYQLEKMEERQVTMSSDLHAIKHNTSRQNSSTESWWARTFDDTEAEG